MTSTVVVDEAKAQTAYDELEDYVEQQNDAKRNHQARLMNRAWICQLARESHESRGKIWTVDQIQSGMRAAARREKIARVRRGKRW